MKKILIVALALIAGFLVYVASKPDTFRVERSAVIQAPAPKLFAILTDLKLSELWSPWEKLDPGMKRTHGGPATGVGATYAWEGNKKVGQGAMKIIETTPPTRVVLSLDFLKPFEAHNTVVYAIQPQPDGSSRLTWSMEGPQPFIGKLMGVLMNCDKMIGADFEKGLANLKALAEK